MLKNIVIAAIANGGLAAGSLPAEAQYTLNGQFAPPAIANLMAAYELPPGHYWAWHGYWGVMGDPRPRGVIPQGDWSGGTPDYPIGRDKNGCIYIPNSSWSNC